MTAGVMVAVLVGLVAVAWIFAPLVRPESAIAERAAGHDSERADLRSRKEMLLGALRDLEDDHDTGKLVDSDYLPLKARLETEAVEVLQRLDTLDGGERRRPAVVPRNEPT